jgi:hypothetical protein
MELTSGLFSLITLVFFSFIYVNRIFISNKRVKYILYKKKRKIQYKRQNEKWNMVFYRVTNDGVLCIDRIYAQPLGHIE